MSEGKLEAGARWKEERGLESKGREGQMLFTSSRDVKEEGKGRKNRKSFRSVEPQVSAKQRACHLCTFMSSSGAGGPRRTLARHTSAPAEVLGSKV